MEQPRLPVTGGLRLVTLQLCYLEGWSGEGLGRGWIRHEMTRSHRVPHPGRWGLGFAFVSQRALLSPAGSVYRCSRLSPRSVLLLLGVLCSLPISLHGLAFPPGCSLHLRADGPELTGGLAANEISPGWKLGQGDNSTRPRGQALRTHVPSQ